MKNYFNFLPSFHFKFRMHVGLFVRFFFFFCMYEYSFCTVSLAPQEVKKRIPVKKNVSHFFCCVFFAKKFNPIRLFPTLKGINLAGQVIWRFFAPTFVSTWTKLFFTKNFCSSCYFFVVLKAIFGNATWEQYCLAIFDQIFSAKEIFIKILIYILSNLS